MAAWIPALLAMIGSLYYSEIVHYQPCTLCWYQRIAMYPLVLILGIAAWRRDLGVRIYAIPLAAVVVPAVMASLAIGALSMSLAAPLAAGAGIGLGVLQEVARWMARPTDIELKEPLQ